MSGCFSLGMVRCRVNELQVIDTTRVPAFGDPAIRVRHGAISSGRWFWPGATFLVSEAICFLFPFLPAHFDVTVLPYHVCALGFSKLYFFYDIV